MSKQSSIVEKRKDRKSTIYESIKYEVFLEKLIGVFYKSLKVSIIVIFSFLLLSGCGGKSIQTFKGSSPGLQPVKFFDGKVEGWGFAENRWGAINQKFEVEFQGETDGDTSIWHETIRYNDGRINERKWKVVKKSDHEYSVEPTEKISKGTGIAYGNAVRWNYYLDVNYWGSNWTLWVDDWMYKKDENTLIVRANLSSFGLTMGYGYMFLRKIE